MTKRIPLSFPDASADYLKERAIKRNMQLATYLKSLITKGLQLEEKTENIEISHGTDVLRNEIKQNDVQSGDKVDVKVDYGNKKSFTPSKSIDFDVWITRIQEEQPLRTAEYSFKITNPDESYEEFLNTHFIVKKESNISFIYLAESKAAKLFVKKLFEVKK